jgi:hypothetical protein
MTATWNKSNLDFERFWCKVAKVYPKHVIILIQLNLLRVLVSIVYKGMKMMNSFAKIVLSVLLLVVVGPTTVSAQRKLIHDELQLAQGLIVDGNLSDWGKELKKEHADQGISYELRNDAEQLYIAIRIAEKRNQLTALNQGIKIQFNIEGKKKDGPAIVFPVADRISLRSLMSPENDNRPEDMREAILGTVKGIQVHQMGDLLDGLISLQNQYGIAAVAIIDANDELTIELAFPIDLIGDVEKVKTRKIAYNVKVGAGIVPMGRTAMPPVRGNPQSGGYPGMSQRGFGPVAPRENPGIWGTFQLARIY